MSSQDRVLRGAPAAVSPSRATGGAASTIAEPSATAEPAQDGSNGGGDQSGDNGGGHNGGGGQGNG